MEVCVLYVIQDFLKLKVKYIVLINVEIPLDTQTILL